jgi:hypothetical protein
MARQGKIARQSYAIRQEVNRRLAANSPGNEIIAWLNGLSEVRAVLQSHGWKPISHSNLSEWRRGGFQDYLNPPAAKVKIRKPRKRPSTPTKARPPTPEQIAARKFLDDYAASLNPVNPGDIYNLFETQFGYHATQDLESRRNALLASACVLIGNLINHPGISQRAVFVFVAKRYGRIALGTAKAGKVYFCASQGTLRRAWLLWKSLPSPDVFKLHWARCGRRKGGKPA